MTDTTGSGKRRDSYYPLSLTNRPEDPGTQYRRLYYAGSYTENHYGIGVSTFQPFQSFSTDESQIKNMARHQPSKIKRQVRNSRIEYRLQIPGKDPITISADDYKQYKSLGYLRVTHVEEFIVYVAVSFRSSTRTTAKGKIISEPVIKTNYSAWTQPGRDKGEPSQLHLVARREPVLARTGEITQTVDNVPVTFSLFNLIEQELSNDAAKQLRSQLGKLIEQAAA